LLYVYLRLKGNTTTLIQPLINKDIYNIKYFPAYFTKFQRLVADLGLNKVSLVI
ncbi:hypothetical protein K432DRAFT_313379, partial [Lepidopterella palustris CBS 459.81]